MTRLRLSGVNGRHVRACDLPADAMIRGDVTQPELAAVLDDVRGADGLVLVTPIYKAAYSGLAKLFLDLLPRHGLRDKVVLPLSVADSALHSDALHHALLPVTRSLAARRVMWGPCVLTRQLAVADGGLVISVAAEDALRETIDDFGAAVAAMVTENIR